MSDVSHISTVDRGLKMKIKRTKLGPAKTDPKHEVVKGESGGGGTPQTVVPGVHLNGVMSTGNTAGSASADSKVSVGSCTPNKAGVCSSDTSKDRSPKVKTPYVKKDKGKDKCGSATTVTVTKLALGENSVLVANGSTCNVGSSVGGSGGGGVAGGTGSVSGLTGVSNGLDILFSQVSMEPRVAVDATAVKREVSRPLLDPYEFNAKEEDRIGLPPKKLKTEIKVETASSPAHCPPYHDVSTETCSIGVVTEPDCLGPCEPGTSVTLEGIVWQETDNGVLVINVTWRGKTYVGTLLDATKHDWAPPRPNCESPVSDFETQIPKGRGKRGRANAGTPVSDRTLTEGRKLRKGRRGSGANFQAPPSPARSDISAAGVKRKGRLNDDVSDKGSGGSKRSRSASRGGASGTESPTPSIIECPEPNCNKKYKHINGLRYHQTHAHQHPMPLPDDEKDDEEDMDSESRKESCVDSDGKDSRKGTLSERAERMKAKELRRREKERERSLEKDCSSLEDNIPLKALSNRTSTGNPDKIRNEAVVTLTKPVDVVKVDAAVSVASLTVTSAVNTCSTTTSTVVTPVSVVARKKEVTPSVSVGMSVSKIGSSGQVYQISGVGCLGGVSVIASSSALQTPVVTPAVAVTANSTLSGPTTTTTTTTTIPISVPVSPMATPAADIVKSESKENIKSKSKLTARPIVPAPSHQVIALASTVTTSQATLVPSGSHPQVSSSLKMIQPRPTIMGEYSNVNPALADLKEKRSKSKKKKEKEGIQSGVSAGASPQLGKTGIKEDPVKNDNSAVIKPVVSSTLTRPAQELTPRKDIVPSIEVSKPTDTPRNTVSSVTLSSNVCNPQVTLKPQDQVRIVQPPGLLTPGVLKASSPLHVNANDRKTPISDDVQSPAYSDISDANDSSSPQQQESPKKDGDNVTKKDNTASGPPSSVENSGVPHYGMYYYSRPSPFMPSNVSTPQASPNSSKSSSQRKDDISRPEDAGSVNAVEEARKGGMDRPEHKDISATKATSVSKTEPTERACSNGATSIPPQQQPQHQQPQHQQQLQEYQQKWLQHLYSQIRLLPQQAQYQYLAAYGMLEPYHQMHFVNQQDPQYRQMMEKASEEQRRMQEQGNKKKADLDQSKKLTTPPPSSGPIASGSEAGPSNVHKFSQSLYNAQNSGTDRIHEGKPADRLYEGKPTDRLYEGKSTDRAYEGKSTGEAAEDREVREQALRDKQTENHQILKENIELKVQMDRNRQEMQQDANRKQTDEIRRIQMFQQQKFMEHQRSAEKRKIELHGKPPELTSSGKGLGIDATRVGISPGGLKSEDIKKEVVDHSRIRDLSSRTPEAKSIEEKKFVDKSREGHIELSNKSKVQDPGNSRNALPVSVASSTAQSNPPATQPGQYSPYAYPSMYPHYATIPVDPNHPMYRSMNPHMIGYATAPPSAYLHPSQLGYRMGLADNEKEGVIKSEGKQTSVSAVEEVGKGPAEALGSQYYGPVHKIHELQEKARPRPGSASPGPAKSGESCTASANVTALPDKQREYSKSPPPQRHLHTHHHTHVLSPGFHVAYADPYAAAMFAAAPHGAAQPPPLQPPFPK